MSIVNIFSPLIISLMQYLLMVSNNVILDCPTLISLYMIFAHKEYHQIDDVFLNISYIFEDTFHNHTSAGRRDCPSSKAVSLEGGLMDVLKV